jgi:predicted permease
MLPSLFASGENARTWSVSRAAIYGAAVGAAAALFKILGPVHAPGSVAAGILDIAGAALAFALLCAGAALARNLIARRWSGGS